MLKLSEANTFSSVTFYTNRK